MRSRFLCAVYVHAHILHHGQAHLNLEDESMNATQTCAHCAQEFDATENGCPACGYLLEPSVCARHAGSTARGRCVICGDSVCEICNSTEPHFSCPDHARIPVFQGWAQVYSTNVDLEAQLIRDNLKSEGIDAETLSQQDRMIHVEVGDLAAVRVLVPAFDYVPAAEIVQSHMDGRGEVAFGCASCGEAYEPGQERCASCQAELPRTFA